MSIALVRFGCILPFTTASAIALSVCIGVAGCLCPNSSNIILMYTASRAVIYSADISASVADDITCLMICAMFNIAPLLGGILLLLDRKKCPPARLRAFSLLR